MENLRIGAMPEPEELIGSEVVVAYNPMAGRRPSRRIAEKLRFTLSQAGLKVYFFDSIWEAAEVATELFETGRLRTFVGVGGDGTFATQVNRTPPGLPLALLPAGTGNVMAKSFKLPKTPYKLAQSILTGKSIWIDAGQANSTIFLNMVSCGFDAAVATAVHEVRMRRDSGHIGYRSYIRPIFGALAQYSFHPLYVTVLDADGGQAEQNTSSNPRTVQSSELPCSANPRNESDPWVGPNPSALFVPSQTLGGQCDSEVMVPPLSSGNLWENSCVCRKPRGGMTFEGRWIFVCNLPRYGWGVKIAPGASAQDGLLDCWIFRRGGLWHGLRYALAVQCGGLHRWLPDCLRVRGKDFFIFASEPVPCQQDGDPAGTVPVRIKVLPRRVRLVLP